MKTRIPCRLESILLVLLGAASAAANGAAAGDPAIKDYADYEALTKQIGELASSGIASSSSLGRTLEGRDVRLLTISAGRPHEKPAVLILGNVYEPHLLGSELAMQLARRLVKAYGQDEQVKTLLRKYTFYIIPRPNPDGSERLFHRPWRERAGNARRTDDDRDFEVGEDPPDDLNGDGWITMMRVRDETGSFMPHPDDARVMIEANAKKNERGSYRVYPEGGDDDKDERWNEDAADGVSFNRNFAFRYPHFKTGAGPHPVSERETRLVADFAFDRPNIAVVFSFAPEDNLMHPWKPNAATESNRIKEDVLSADAPFFEFLAERYREIHGGKDAPTSPPGAGSFAQWAYFHYGRWSLAARAWWPPKTTAASAGEAGDVKKAKKGESGGKAESSPKKAEGAPSAGGKTTSDQRGAEELNALRWLDRNGIRGFVDWTPIRRPDFPDKRVEVGGFQPFCRLNPPAKELDDLGERHFRFLIELTSLLPRVEFRTTKVDSLGGGVYRIAASVVNRGYLPTMSEMGRLSRRAYPLQIELQPPEGAELIQGPLRRRLDRLAGNGGASEQTWVVRLRQSQPAAAKLRVWAPAVGSDETTIRWKEKG